MSKKNTNRILLTILPIIAAAGMFLLFSKSRKKQKSEMQKQQIAEEGYETAGDILFPPKYSTQRYKNELN